MKLLIVLCLLLGCAQPAHLVGCSHNADLPIIERLVEVANVEDGKCWCYRIGSLSSQNGNDVFPAHLDEDIRNLMVFRTPCVEAQS